FENSLMVPGQPEFQFRAEHAFGLHAANHRGLEGDRVGELAGALAMRAAGQPRTDFGERRRHPGARVRRPTDDLEMPRRAGVNFALIQAIGVGMAFDVEHLGNKHAVESRCAMLDALDLESGHREAPAQLVDIGLERDEFLEPTERQLHDAASLAERNWLRKRRSFSKNRRRSSTPSLSSDVRSTPM